MATGTRFDGLTDLCVQDLNVLHVNRRIGPGMNYAPAAMFAWTSARAVADLDQDGDMDLLGESTLWNSRFSGPSAGHRRQYGIGEAAAAVGDRCCRCSVRCAAATPSGRWLARSAGRGAATSLSSGARRVTSAPVPHLPLALDP